MLFFVCGIFLGSCSKSDYGSGFLYTPTIADTTTIATLEELQQGRDIYINNCNECHYLYSPDDKTANDWREILPIMAPRAGLTENEVALVTKYVTRGK